MGALDDIRVLDLTQHIAGPYATKLLADYGADVIKVEPPDGDITRRLGPFLGDDEHPEKSGLFLYLNTNKRSIALDLRSERGREQLAALAGTADVAVESFAPGTLDNLGCGWDFLRSVNPALPLVSISNFGQDGPYRDYKATELTMYGFAGEMYSIGQTEREPVKLYGTAGLIESGSAAAVAVLGALYAAKRHGIAQHVDVAIAETHAGGVDRRHATFIASQFSGRKTLRVGGAASGMPGGIYPCADGFVDFTAAGAPARMPRVIDMIGEAWARDPRFADRLARLNPEIIAEWNGHFYEWCLTRTKREIWAEARRAKVMCGPMFTMEDLFTDGHFRDRGFWATAEHPVMGAVQFPGRPFLMQHGGWELRRPAPLLDQHKGETWINPRTPVDSSPRPPRHSEHVADVSGEPVGAPRPASSSPLPLAGVRVIDFCVVWAGPFASVLLADLGAEVIKVENPYIWQPGTRGGMARPPQAVLDAGSAWSGGYPNNEPGPRPWNYCPTFVSLYRNKKSFSCNLMTPEGMETLRQLVMTADVLYENNATDTMERLGITYDWLKEVRPDLIMVRAPAYGSSGPYAYARALGVHLEGVMGHTALRGYADGDPTDKTAIYSGDYVAGTQGAFAVMTALWQRDRTGKGQLIELAQAENASGMFAQAMMDYSLNRRSQEAIGNADIFGRFPCNVYPTRPSADVLRAQGLSAPSALSTEHSAPVTANSAASLAEPPMPSQATLAETMDDRWVSIHVQSDAEWLGLQRAMGSPDWAADRRFATNAGRAAHAAEIDAAIARWTAGLDDYEVMRRCQSEGVAALPVLESSRMKDDPHLQARGFFRQQTLPDVGTYAFVGPLWRLPETPVQYTQPPVTFGEHNDWVYHDLLGVTSDRMAKLEADGHIATEFDKSIP